MAYTSRPRTSWDTWSELAARAVEAMDAEEGYSRVVIRKLVIERISRLKTSQRNEGFSPSRAEYVRGQIQAYEQVEAWL